METGFLRCRPSGKVELVLAHNTGFVEIWYGEADGGQARAAHRRGRRAPRRPRRYTGGKRLYGNVEGDLLYAYDMAAMGQELQPHTLGTAAAGSEPR